jgi:hypothetical protein
MRCDLHHAGVARAIEDWAEIAVKRLEGAFLEADDVAAAAHELRQYSRAPVMHG